MSFVRRIQRETLKKQFKELKKSDPRVKNLRFPEFKDIWTRALLDAQKEKEAASLTSSLDDMIVNEIRENEDTTSEQKDTD